MARLAGMPSNVPASPADQDWTYKAADQIEAFVGQVRSKTTVPATLAARGVVYGLVVGVLGAAFLFLLILAGTRILDVYLPFHPLARRVWVADAAAAAIFLGSGAFAWRMRRPKDAD